MVVEIMTPHFGKYYRGEDTPHDSGAPVPVSFLAVPAGSSFDFHVVCQPSRLQAALQGNWKELVARAFQHAFEWVGFGAKTSVGYGAMKIKAGTVATGNTANGATSTAGSAPSEITTELLVWPNATLTLNKGTGEVKASFEGKSTAGLKGDGAKKLLADLGDERSNKLRSKQELKNVAVTVEKQGNSLMLRGLSST